MTTGPNTLVGKLSFWAFLMMFLTWLARQILAYLFVIITPWLNWLIGWGVLVGAIFLGVMLLLGGMAVYFAFRSWRAPKQESRVDAAA
jgi:hypothetical protein